MTRSRRFFNYFVQGVRPLGPDAGADAEDVEMAPPDEDAPPDGSEDEDEDEDDHVDRHAAPPPFGRCPRQSTLGCTEGGWNYALFVRHFMICSARVSPSAMGTKALGETTLSRSMHRGSLVF